MSWAENEPQGMDALPRHHIRLVIFDFDDTLAKTAIDFPGVKLQLAGELARLGLALPGDARKEPLAWLIERAAAFPEVQAAMWHKVEEAELAGLARMEWSPGALTTARWLRTAGYAVAILTNNGGAAVRRKLRDEGVEQLFDVVWGREDVPETKPRPGGLMALLRRFFTDAGEAVLVGDSSHDEAAAKAAGIHYIHYGDGGDDGGDGGGDGGGETERLSVSTLDMLPQLIATLSSYEGGES